MILAERRRKLKKAEDTLKAVTRRIARLVTAQRAWARRVKMHRDKLAAEEAAQPVIIKRDALLRPIVTGRKFRDIPGGDNEETSS